MSPINMLPIRRRLVGRPSGLRLTVVLLAAQALLITAPAAVLAGIDCPHPPPDKPPPEANKIIGIWEFTDGTKGRVDIVGGLGFYVAYPHPYVKYQGSDCIHRIDEEMWHMLWAFEITEMPLLVYTGDAVWYDNNCQPLAKRGLAGWRVRFSGGIGYMTMWSISPSFGNLEKSELRKIPVWEDGDNERRRTKKPKPFEIADPSGTIELLPTNR